MSILLLRFLNKQNSSKNLSSLNPYKINSESGFFLITIRMNLLLIRCWLKLKEIDFLRNSWLTEISIVELKCSLPTKIKPELLIGLNNKSELVKMPVEEQGVKNFLKKCLIIIEISQSSINDVKTK
jgi:hypothetical protein